MQSNILAVAVRDWMACAAAKGHLSSLFGAAQHTGTYGRKDENIQMDSVYNIL